MLAGVGPALLFRRLPDPLRVSLHPRRLHEGLATLVHGGALLLRYLGLGALCLPRMTGNGKNSTCKLAYYRHMVILGRVYDDCFTHMRVFKQEA